MLMKILLLGTSFYLFQKIVKSFIIIWMNNWKIANATSGGNASANHQSAKANASAQNHSHAPKIFEVEYKVLKGRDH